MVPVFSAISHTGKPVSVDFAADPRPTVLYVTRPSCDLCARNLASLRVLTTTRRKEFRFVVVSLPALAAGRTLDEGSLPVTLVSDPSKETRATYLLGPTPQTMVISSQGRLLQNWIGAYDGRVQTEVDAYFKVTLPGVQPVGEASCKDEKGALYSQGFIATIGGKRQECGADGKWKKPTR